MIGKYFLAVACLSLAQVRGLELQDVINDGLTKVEALNERGSLRIQEAINEVEGKRNLIRTTTEALIVKAQELQSKTGNNLRNTARETEERGRELNRPAKAFKCILNAEANNVNHITALTTKYTTDMERLERTKLSNLETAAKPLDNAELSLIVRYTRAVNQINLCKTSLCVENNVNSCSVWVDKLFSDIDRTISQVTTAYNNYIRDSNVITDNTNIQIISTEDVGLRQIQLCIRD